MSKAAKKMIVGAVAASAMGVGSASASMIDYNVSGPNADAADEQAFLDTLRPGSETTETFEEFAANTQSVSFPTSVGTFTGSGNASGDACNDATRGFTCGEGLGIVDVASGGDFAGRHPLPEQSGNSQYLDSLDHEQMTFNVAPGNNAVGFFLTDPNDAGGILDITLADGSNVDPFQLSDILGGAQDNAGAFYLSFYAQADIDSISLNANSESDGFGVDNVTVGTVPEPGTLALFGLGLVGLGVSRRRSQ